MNLLYTHLEPCLEVVGRGVGVEGFLTVFCTMVPHSHSGHVFSHPAVAEGTAQFGFSGGAPNYPAFDAPFPLDALRVTALDNDCRPTFIAFFLSVLVRLFNEVLELFSLKDIRICCLRIWILCAHRPAHTLSQPKFVSPVRLV